MGKRKAKEKSSPQTKVPPVKTETEYTHVGPLRDRLRAHGAGMLAARPRDYIDTPVGKIMIREPSLGEYRDLMGYIDKSNDASDGGPEPVSVTLRMAVGRVLYMARDPETEELLFDPTPENPGTDEESPGEDERELWEHSITGGDDWVAPLSRQCDILIQGAFSPKKV